MFLLVPQTNVIIDIHPVLLCPLYNTKNIAYLVTEEWIFNADKIMVMGNSKNSCVFNLVILLKSQNLMLAKYTCFTVHRLLIWKTAKTNTLKAKIKLQAKNTSVATYKNE